MSKPMSATYGRKDLQSSKVPCLVRSDVQDLGKNSYQELNLALSRSTVTRRFSPTVASDRSEFLPMASDSSWARARCAPSRGFVAARMELAQVASLRLSAPCALPLAVATRSAPVSTSTADTCPASTRFLRSRRQVLKSIDPRLNRVLVLSQPEHRELTSPPVVPDMLDWGFRPLLLVQVTVK